MHFSRLQLTQFRNYTSLAVEFSAGINCITGNNGEGKTNVLEAIHYLAMTRGWNSKTEKYALQEDAPYFAVDGHLETDAASTLVQCTYMPPKGKKLLLNRKAVKRMSEHIGRIPLVAILPHDTQLIDGPPAVRRKFMDGLISQYSRDYLDHLLAYDKGIQQRNALLAMMAERGTWDPDQLDMWEEALVPHGQAIVEERRAFLEAYRPHFLHYFKAIVSDKESPVIELESQLQENDAAEWRRLLRQSRDRDRFSHRSSAGCHKDDLAFTINGQDVRNYGSQGQQKTFVAALKLAQYELLAQRTTVPPILLLDDIFDKLDMHRLGAIAGILEKDIPGQVFITDTSEARTREVFMTIRERPVRYFSVGQNSVRETVSKHEA